MHSIKSHQRMLDNHQDIIKKDKQHVVKATQMLADQCQQTWEETHPIQLPADYSDVNHVIVAGMGGSHLGAQLISSVYDHQLRIPLIIKHQYQKPGFVDQNSLVISTSVSGDTEETLAFAQESLAAGAKLICISSGGKLADFAKKHNLPHYIFDPKFNPSRIPRYGSGYLFVSQMAFLSKIGAISLTKTDIDSIVSTLHLQIAKFEPTKLQKENPAKALADSIQDQTAIIVAAEHLIGPAYIFKNQLNESAKHFATLFSIPELDHHLLESLAHPSSNPDNLHFIFFESDHYLPKNTKRINITKEIINKQHIKTSSFQATSSTAVTQAFETLAFSSYTALYLAYLNKVDPGPNPWVDYLKERLK